MPALCHGYLAPLKGVGNESGNGNEYKSYRPFVPYAAQRIPQPATWLCTRPPLLSRSWKGGGTATAVEGQKPAGGVALPSCSSGAILLLPSTPLAHPLPPPHTPYTSPHPFPPFPLPHAPSSCKFGCARRSPRCFSVGRSEDVGESGVFPWVGAKMRVKAVFFRGSERRCG